MTDKDVVKGKLKQAEGKTQEAIADATGSKEDQIAGKAKQGVGKVQEAVGHAKDSAKDKLSKDHH